MSIEQLEDQVLQLPRDERRRFARWFYEHENQIVEPREEDEISVATKAEILRRSRWTACQCTAVRATFRRMSTIAEIESAIESLPSPEVARLAVWLEEFRRRRAVPGGGEHHELDGLIGTWQEDAAFETAQRAFEQVDGAMWK